MLSAGARPPDTLYDLNPAMDQGPASNAKTRLTVVAWLGVAITAIYIRIASYGYNPTDDGNILAQTYRILHGQVPHKDVIFARPMGSSIFHTIDYLIPLSLFKASRLMGIAEFALYSVLFAVLILRSLPTRWTLPTVVLVLGSLITNMHTFPLMGWYTTDGLLFTALGFVLLAYGRSSPKQWFSLLGLCSLGLAPVMKQSFFAAPVIGVLMLVWWSRTDQLTRVIKKALVGTACAALPFTIYGLAVTFLGGLHDMTFQLTHVHGVDSLFNSALFHPERDPQVFRIISGSMILVVTSLLFSSLRQRSDRMARLGSLGDLLTRVALTTIAIGLPLMSHFRYLPGSWSLSLFWMLVIAVLWRSALDRRLDSVGLLIAAIGWMASLSWGYGLPSLVSGAMLLTILVRLWSDIPRPRLGRVGSGLLGAAAIVAFSAYAGQFLHVRDTFPYFDRPRRELTVALDDVSPQFKGLKTNPVTAAYLRTIKSCVDSHPARSVAILPDNPGIYPALHLHNPFPIDWMFPDEVQGEEQRILKVADRLSADGDYLILFQTYSAFDLASRTTLGRVASQQKPFFYGLPLGNEIYERLTGQRVTCGPLFGMYKPNR